MEALGSVRRRNEAGRWQLPAPSWACSGNYFILKNASIVEPSSAVIVSM